MTPETPRAFRAPAARTALRGVFMEAGDPAPMTPETPTAPPSTAAEDTAAEALRLQGRREEEEARLRRARARVRGIQGVYGPVPNR